MAEKLVCVQSNQADVKVKKHGEVSFEYEFKGPDNKVQMIKEHAEIIIKNSNFKIVGKQEEGESEQENKKAEFLEELKKINGIGAKTAKDIVGIYITKERLIESIEKKHEIPFDDDIEKSLKETYGGK